MNFRVWLEMNYEFSKIKIYLPIFQSHHAIHTGDKVCLTEKLARSIADKILRDTHLSTHVLMMSVNPKELVDSHEENMKTYHGNMIMGNVVYKTD